MSDTFGLAAVPLFRGLTDDQLRAVERVLKPARAKAGDEILREGEPGRSLFVLRTGTVVTSKHMGVMGPEAATPRQKVLVRMTAPQAFGEIGLLEDSPRSATIRAETDCELLELHREGFEALVSSDVRLAYLLMRNITMSLIQRLRRTDRDMVKLTAALSIALGNR